MYSKKDISERLSISTLVFYQYCPVCERSLQYLIRNGIHKIELLECPEQFDMTDRRSMQMIGEICKSVGVEISAYHCFKTNFDGIATAREYSGRLDRCKRQIDNLMEWGGAVWGSHAGTPDKTMRSAFEELARYVEGKPVVVTVENFNRDDVSVAERIRFVQQMDHPQVGLILDIGHEKNPNGENVMTIPGQPTKIVHSCGSFLKHIHLHGYLGKDHYPPFVSGDRILWSELFAALEKNNYSGPFNFEPVGEPGNSFPRVVEAVGQAPSRIAALAEDP